MGSLSNLYISQSYQSLLHFSTDNSASATLTQLQDGVGQNLGLFLNTNGDLRTTTSVSSSTIEATNLKIKNKIELTGSIDIDGPVTASSAFIEADLIVSGTLFAKEVHTLIESSSIIFSTGSNILGDSTADTQTLIGTIIVSGSEEITGSLFVRNDISSSTLNGVGNVTLYSQSVDYRLDNLETYSGSAEQKFVAIQASTSSLNNFTASQLQKDSALETWTGSTFVTFSQSVDFRLDELENWSSSLQTNFVTEVQLTQTASFLQNQINQKLDTASFNSYTQSTNIVVNNLNAFTSSANSRLNSLESATSSYANSASVAAVDSAQTVRIDGLSAATSSYLLASSNNTFTANNIFSGSVRGALLTLSVSSNTASMDCSLGNFFTLTLPSSATTRLIPTNVQPGQTISLRILQQATTGSLTYNSSTIKFPSGSLYQASAITGATDILTFVSYDTTTLFATNVKNMI